MTSHLFEYRHEGEMWGIEIVARDADDARARLRSLAFARYKGEVVAKVHAPTFSRARRWLRAALAPDVAP